MPRGGGPVFVAVFYMLFGGLRAFGGYIFLHLLVLLRSNLLYHPTAIVVAFICPPFFFFFFLSSVPRVEREY